MAQHRSPRIGWLAGLAHAREHRLGRRRLELAREPGRHRPGAEGRRASPTRASSNTVKGKLTCTGPGLPEMAVAMARAMSWPSPGVCAVQAALVTGLPCPRRRNSGRRRARALETGVLTAAVAGVRRLAVAKGGEHWRPAPPLTKAMPHWPINRPQASAMRTAAASWRTCSKPRLEPSAASKIGMMWLPDRVKTCECPPALGRARRDRRRGSNST